LARSIIEENNTSPTINNTSLLLCGCETWIFSKMEEKDSKSLNGEFKKYLYYSGVERSLEDKI
jgi:hypothetical protein